MLHTSCVLGVCSYWPGPGAMSPAAGSGERAGKGRLQCLNDGAFPTRLLLTRTAANVPILSSPSCFLDMLGYFLDHLHLGVLLNDGSVGGSELEEMGKSADEVSHTISVSTSALLAF